MNYLLVFLIWAGWAVLQASIGGTRPVFSLPAYIIIGVAGVFSMFLLRARRIHPSVWCMGISVLFFGYVLGRTLTSPVPYIAADDLTMVLAALIIYLLTALYLVDQRVRLVLVSGLLLLAAIHIGVGIVQFVQGDQFMLFGIERVGYGRRASGLYICPNHLAGFLEVMVVMGLGLVFWSRMRFTSKILIGYISLGALLGVALSGSRGGYLSTAACLVLFLALSLYVVKVAMPERIWKLGLILAVVIIGLIGGALAMMSKSDLLSDRLANIPDYKNMRLEMWAGALEQFQLSPWVGTGSRTYLYYGRQFRVEGGFQKDPIFPHNDYLQLLAEYGGIGVLLFCLFLGVHLLVGLRSLQHIVTQRLPRTNGGTSNALALNIGSLCAVGALVVHSVVDFNMHIPGNTLVMAFFFGILANPGVEIVRGEERKKVFAMVFRLLVPILALWLLWVSVARVKGEVFAEKARIALRDEEFAKAIKLAKEGLKSQPSNPELYHHIGESRLYLGETMSSPLLRRNLQEGAVKMISAGLEYYPQDLWRLISLGQALDELERFEESKEVYARILAADQFSGQVHSYLGLHYERQGQFEKARAEFLIAKKYGDAPLAIEGLKRLKKVKKTNIP